MAKAPPPGRCVHCLKTFSTLTWDHGIPLSWYPVGHSGLKVKAPSCQPCQIRLAKVEHEFLLPLALTLDPTDPLCFGVPQAARRAIDPTQVPIRGRKPADIARDKRAREALRKKVQSRVFVPTSTRETFPGFGPEHVQGSRIALMGPHTSEVQTIGEKFARVAIWSMRGEQFVEPETEITTHVVNIEDVPEVERFVREGEAMDIFPGVRITLHTAAASPRTHISLFEVWGRLKLFVSVIHPPPWSFVLSSR